MTCNNTSALLPAELNAKFTPFIQPATAAGVAVAAFGGPNDVGEQGLIDLGFALRSVSLQSDTVGDTVTALDILDTSSTILLKQFTDDDDEETTPGFTTVQTLEADLGPITAGTPLLALSPTAPLAAANAGGRRKLFETDGVAATNEPAPASAEPAAAAGGSEPLPVVPEAPVTLHASGAAVPSDPAVTPLGSVKAANDGDDNDDDDDDDNDDDDNDDDDDGGNATVARIYLVLEPGTTAIGFWSSIGCGQTGELEIEFNAENDEDFDGKDDDGDGKDEDGSSDWNDRRHRMLLGKTAESTTIAVGADDTAATAAVTRSGVTSRRLLRGDDDDDDGFGDDIGDNDDIEEDSPCFGVDFTTLTPEQQALCQSYVRSLTQRFTVPVDCTAGPIGGFYQAYVYGAAGFLRQVEIKVKVPANGAAYIGGMVVSNTQIGA